MKRSTPLILLLFLLAPLAAACAGQSDHAYQMAPLGQMPPEVRQAPATVRQAYQFATFNHDVLSQLPCYCGCGAMGHVSNDSCYVQGREGNGDIVYDNHALGCSICVDITQDAMRMLDEGRSIDEIADYVDATYSRFGPPTPLQGPDR